MATLNLDNLQGDLFSRGFPKFHETYYFFSIVDGKEKQFSQSLTVLGRTGQISSLSKVLADWKTIYSIPSGCRVDLSNALIAFSKKGLDRIQLGLPDAKSLSLDKLKKSDHAFARGMTKDGPAELNDPPADQWDSLFNTNPIHGILKVAGKSPETVANKLDVIKAILGHGTVITDIEAESKLDGKLRPDLLKGHEHFGFRDGLSQPLLEGIDRKDNFDNSPAMKTPQKIITVTDDPPPAQEGYQKLDPKQRPKWMIDGSFLVFRKLEQDVKKYDELTKQFEAAHCTSPDQFGAKLMGRWKSGGPITLSPDNDPNDKKPTNNFEFEFTTRNVCPLGAHIRKTNPRDGMGKTEMSRIVRNGIPYGEEISQDPEGKRGLLFACYSSSIDNGFKFIQKDWSNNETFPQWKTTAGHDPFIGQHGPDQDFHITMFDAKEEDVIPRVILPKLVTMRGGEYFFVPSISALSEVLGTTA